MNSWIFNVAFTQPFNLKVKKNKNIRHVACSHTFINGIDVQASIFDSFDKVWHIVIVFFSILLCLFSPLSCSCRLKDLGLERFSVGILFTRIFIPTSFLLVCILHLHYFHEHFLELTDLKAVAAKQDNAIYRWSNDTLLLLIVHVF